MRSMYSGVSGLRVHQTKMDVIGNNIANVNTVGYKKASVSFKEAFNQVINGGTAPSGGCGGTNPQQIGLGLNLGSINTIHTTGSIQTTDNPTDLMIDGEGFFMISGDANAENRLFTRAGNFTFDIDGNLVTPNGFKVLGSYIGDQDYAKYLGIDPSKEIDGIRVSKSIPAPASASTKIELKGNLDSRLPEYDDGTDINEDGKHVTDAYIKDSLGNSYKVVLRFEKTGNANEWDFTVPEIKRVSDNQVVATNLTTQTLTFDGGTGALTGATSFLIDLSGFATDIHFGVPDGSASGFTEEINIDLSTVTQFANESSAEGFDAENASGQIGMSAGTVTGFSIGESGKVTASFDNGVKKELWQIKLANFNNPSGLIKSGSNTFEKSPNSGEPQMGVPASGGFGPTKAGSLEMSNVDLSLEFTEMISTQRGFQANSRIITTTDEMLQELANMKR